MLVTHFCGFMILYVYMSIGKGGWSRKWRSGNFVTVQKGTMKHRFHSQRHLVCLIKIQYFLFMQLIILHCSSSDFT